MCVSARACISVGVCVWQSRPFEIMEAMILVSTKRAQSGEETDRQRVLMRIAKGKERKRRREEKKRKRKRKREDKRGEERRGAERRGAERGGAEEQMGGVERRREACVRVCVSARACACVNACGGDERSGEERRGKDQER